MTPETEKEGLLKRIDELQSELYEIRRVLGAGGEAAPLPSESFDVLICRAGRDRFGIDLGSVIEAVRVAKLTPLPEASAWVPGILNLRGCLVPVIDLTARMNRSERLPALSDIIVICKDKGRVVGLLVEEILETGHAEPGDVEPIPEGIALAPYLVGMIRHNEHTTHLISVEVLVSSSDLPEEQL